MPVTAKLSNRFYQQFGDETTNELVEWLNTMDVNSQIQLREAIDNSFAQFRAEMRVLFAEADVKFEKRFAEADVKLERRFADFDVKFTTAIARVESRLAWQLMAILVSLLGVALSLSGQLRH
jgi:hypothetical protein